MFISYDVVIVMLKGIYSHESKLQREQETQIKRFNFT